MITRLYKRISKRSLLNKFSAVNTTKFDSLDEAISTINLEAPTFYLLLVNEDWHPQAEEASKHLNKAAEQFYGTLPCYEVNGSNDARFAKYYSARHCPEFLICVYGQDIRRHVGLDYDTLVDKIQKTLKWSQDNDLPIENRIYMPFETSYKMARQEYERAMQQEKL